MPAESIQPVEIVTVPCRTDNYAYLIARGGQAALVDAPEVDAIAAVLEDRGWDLSSILITHHHDDHIAGVPELSQRYGAQVVGARADAHRLPRLDLAVSEGDALTVCGEEVRVLDVSGHTVGHIAFHLPGASAVFTADSLMALGCGRLFEGTAPQMWASLSKLAALPPETMVYSGHEYTASNARFAVTIEPDNAALASRAESVRAAREGGRPTVPSRLSEELATNPFLRAGQAETKRAIGMDDAEDVAVFAEIRARKDRF